MPVKDTNTRIIITVSKEMKALLEEAAKKEQRSLTNLINVILSEYLESKE